LTHFDEQGRARQVDVSKKQITTREAIARGSVVMKPETLALIAAGQVEKGNVLEVARLAAIGGAKLTPQLIPLTHAIPLDQVELEFSLDKESNSVRIEAMARATARTGVEMEAITAVVTAALTIYDMCKAVDRQMWIQDVRLIRKTGGSSGDLFLED
jgi:cyclic pyranopterin phosphate synthase